MNENFAIQLFDGKKVRIVWDAEQEKYYFSVTDIVQVLTDSTDVSHKALARSRHYQQEFTIHII